jgi:peptidyl-prolyl cis-trans isomerase D
MLGTCTGQKARLDYALHFSPVRLGRKIEADKMLNQVRDKLKGAVAWIFVVLLVGAFSLFGVPEVRQLTGNSALAVGGERYSAQYVQNEFNRAVNQRRRESNGKFTQEDAIASGLPDQVISSITTNGALKQLGKSMRLVVPREMVADFLQKNENFQNSATGRFDETVLQTILGQNGITASEFEDRIAEDMMRSQLVNALTAGGPAPELLTEAVLLRNTERRLISYLIVTNEMSGIPAEPTPDDLQNYYQQNPATFTAPEYRTFDILELRAEDFREGLTVSEEELRRLYDINKPRLYDIPETRTLYQITLDTQPDAQAAVAALRQGKPFENIATERGLTLDSVTFSDAQKSEILDPAVAEAAFQDGQSAGDILDPVQSLFGWTVVQIANVNPPQTKEYDEVRDDLEADFLANDTRRAMLSAVDLIEEERDTGATLAVAAEAAGLTVQSVGPADRFGITPGGVAIENLSGDALNEAFRLEEGEESEALELTDTDGYYFVSMREITEPTLKPYDDVRDDVERRWREQERTTRISKTARSIREAVEKGASLAEAAAPFNRTPIEMFIDRRFENEAISRQFNDRIFFAERGDIILGPAALGEAQIVAQIKDIGFSRNSVSPGEVDILRQYIGYQLDQELLEAFVTQIRNDYGVNVNRAQLDLVFGELQ